MVQHQQMVMLFERQSLSSGALPTELQLRQYRHPKGHHFLLAYDGRNFFELQSVQPRKFASWFLAQRVSSNKHLYLGNAFDMRFLLLPYLEKAQGRYSPLDQIVRSEDGEDRLPLDAAVEWWNLKSICDVNDQYGDDMILYRYSNEKVRLWLRHKVLRTAKALYKQRLARQAAANPTFVSSFNLNAKPRLRNEPVTRDHGNENLPQNVEDSSAAKAPASDEYEREDLLLAVEVIGDYVTDATVDLLLREFDFTADDLKKSSATEHVNKKRKADWEQELELEKETLAYAPMKKMESGNIQASTSSAAKINSTNAAVKTVKAEKFASAAKGTASLHSFFKKK